MVKINHVEGEQPVQVMIYALSTCGWCKKTKAYFSELGVGYDYIDVDTLSEPEKSQIMEEVRKWNPSCSFPTVVIDGKECIVGFQQEKLREAVSK